MTSIKKGSRLESRVLRKQGYYDRFTDEEVREMLDYYCLGGQYELIRDWYDG